MKVREDCGQPHQTVGVNWLFTVWLPRQRHNRCNLCCQAAAREVSSCQQETLHGFIDLERVFDPVGAEKTWCGGVGHVTAAGDVCHCPEPCPCWWEVQWRVSSEGWCSQRLGTQPPALHHCAWSIAMQVPLWGSLRGPLCRWPCYHRWIAPGMCQEALDSEGSNGGERTESKCRKDEDHDLWYSPGPHAEFRQVSTCCLSHWIGQQQHLLQRLQALGAQEMQWTQTLEKGPWLQMYTMPGNCMPHGRQHTEESPRWTWQAGGGSFLMLPRRHALSSWWLWTYNHNSCENHMEDIQGAATSSLSPPPLFLDMWLRVQLLCVERNAPCQWDLATDKAKPSSAAKWQCNDQTDLQCQAALSPSGPMRYLRSLASRIWTSFWRREGPTGMDTPTVQSRQLWHTGWWKVWAWEAQDDTEAADREGLQRVEALSYWPSW